jgi:hypothetical protein
MEDDIDTTPDGACLDYDGACRNKREIAIIKFTAIEAS